MKNKKIMVIDSGIGGISVLCELKKYLPCEHYIYYGDNDNAPYGNKTDANLKKIVESLCETINQYNIKLLIIACNTLSVNYINVFKDKCKIPVIGVFPPIEKYQKKWGKAILLATEKTCKALKKKNINKNIILCPLKNLASDIEKSLFDLEKIDISSQIKDKNIKNKKFDSVILGCTHYFFVKNKIFDHFCPKNIISGNHLAVISAKKKLKSNKSLGNYKRFSVSFVGKNAKDNEKFYKKVVKRCHF